VREGCAQLFGDVLGVGQVDLGREARDHRLCLFQVSHGSHPSAIWYRSRGPEGRLKEKGPRFVEGGFGAALSLRRAVSTTADL
jgi:hypothetical protein